MLNHHPNNDESANKKIFLKKNNKIILNNQRCSYLKNQEKNEEFLEKMLESKVLINTSKQIINNDFEEEINFEENRMHFSRAHWIQMHKDNISVNLYPC